VFRLAPKTLVAFTEKITPYRQEKHPVLTRCFLRLKALKYFSEKLEGIKEIIQAYPDIDSVVCVALVREVLKFDNGEYVAYIR
jgi:peroxiredoxin